MATHSRFGRFVLFSCLLLTGCATHVPTACVGDAETLGLMELALSRLAGSALFLEGGHPLDLRLEFAEARYDQDLTVYHGLLRYRAVTPAPATTALQ